MASSQSLTKRSATDTQLMPPPPTTKKIKRPTTVLDEDSYTDALSHIIARDYFPGLLETQTRQEVLDALESRDKQWIARAGRRLEEVMTPGRTGRKRGRRGVSMTPAGQSRGVTETPTTTTTMYGGDTPLSTTRTPVSVASTPTTTTTMTTNKDRSQQKAAIDVSNLSLNAFQAKYTSEDNESFNKVLDTQNDTRRAKYAWMWNGNKILSARQIAHRQRETKRIADRGGGDGAVGGKELVAAISTDMDARPAAPESWKAGVQNSLMFSPDDNDTETYETRAQKAEASSRAGPKHVVYENTRLPITTSSNAVDESLVPPSPSLSAIKDAIAGRIRPTDSEPGFTGGETPRVNGYTFVDEEDEEEDEAMYERLRQLASQGINTGTGGDDSPNPFNIKQNRKREDLHHRMVDTVAQKKRAEKAAPHQLSSSSTPRFPSSPMFSSSKTPRGNMTPSGRNLTPAAQKLLQRVGSTPRRAGTSSSSSGLKNMWTPTPRRHK